MPRRGVDAATVGSPTAGAGGCWQNRNGCRRASLANQNRALGRRITGQLIALEELQNGSFTGDEPKVKNDATAIQAILEDFVKEFRDLKKEIHHLTKIVSKTEKFNSLIKK